MPTLLRRRRRRGAARRPFNRFRTTITCSTRRFTYNITYEWFRGRIIATCSSVGFSPKTRFFFLYFSILSTLSLSLLFLSASKSPAAACCTFLPLGILKHYNAIITLYTYTGHTRLIGVVNSSRACAVLALSLCRCLLLLRTLLLSYTMCDPTAYTVVIATARPRRGFLEWPRFVLAACNILPRLR